MKSIIITGIIIGITVFSVRVYHVAQDPAKYGIIMVEGWEHGVALCGEAERETEVITQEGEYHMWAQNDILYTINYGHMDDDEVVMLRALATVHCNNLN